MKDNKGFTLLELLVVVLIIGILASIALPQYQMAVGRSKLAELKTRAKAIAEAGHMYVLEHGKLLEEEEEEGGQVMFDLSKLNIELPEDEITCSLYRAGSNYNTACQRSLFDVTIRIVMVNSNLSGCGVSGSDNLNHPASKLCAQETGDTNPVCPQTGQEEHGRCLFHYPTSPFAD